METKEVDVDAGRPQPQAIRGMEPQDIAQLVNIEREAFPTQWPPTPFRQDLRNRMARYLVSWHADRLYEPPAQPPLPPPTPNIILRWARVVVDKFTAPPAPEEPTELISGYVGVWLIAGEAHITSIAVAERFKGSGLGELLVLGALEMALDRDCTVCTLEVRVSNTVAQNLYTKWGFEIQGVRKAYYMDNREDAYIMTTPSFSTDAYQDLFHQRRNAFEARYGPVPRDFGLAPS
ncbi:MAG: ribosomal-protein-alanine N-acetyltransferase [Chloroflexi bacterium]|jgi:ribosomal-protein-alanine N-acetyltransferase|nr:MAG: ribosomal-protein-alanine N-acetyltransferase [Chloroflexota bacterium]